MASNRKMVNGDYIYGSEAPARLPQEPVRRKQPDRRPLTKEEQRQLNRTRYARENQRKAARFGGLYTLFITCAVVVVLFVFVHYISLQNQQTENAKEITAMKEQLNALKEKNNQTELTIDTSIDYDYIYKVATEQLGMIPVEANQIVKYKSGESEYVIQYSDVPENQK